MCDIYEREFDRAIERLDDGIRRWRHTPRALGYFWHNKGWVHSIRSGLRTPESLREANTCYGIAVDNDPSRTISRMNLIVNHLRSGDLDAAEKEFKAVGEDPESLKQFMNAVKALDPRSYDYLFGSPLIQTRINNDDDSTT
jgi:23S rRNA A2030 N6-methylase RlmJ